MVGPHSEGPPPAWAVGPDPGPPPEGSPKEPSVADGRLTRGTPSWQGNVSDGVDAWLRAVAAGEITQAPTADTAPAHDTVGTVEGAASGLAPDDDGSGNEADHEAVARKILLDQLTGQARSRKELADRLARKNVPDGIAERLLDRFEEVGLIDDEAFARAWIASRQPGKGLARRALGQELRRKGIDDLVAREALDEIDPDDEEAAARRLVRKRLRSMAGLDNVKATRRLVGMLARKGYPPGMSFSVVREELAAADEPDDEPLEGPSDW